MEQSEPERKRASGVRIIIFLLFSLCSTFWAYPALAEGKTQVTVSSPPANIVFLFSFGQGLPYYEKLYNGFLSVTKPAGITNENLFIEYMDLVRHSEKEYRRRLADLYRYKYPKHNIRMIIVEGEPALKFLLEEGRDLFPQAPAFCIYGPETVEWDRGAARSSFYPLTRMSGAPWTMRWRCFRRPNGSFTSVEARR